MGKAGDHYFAGSMFKVDRQSENLHTFPRMLQYIFTKEKKIHFKIQYIITDCVHTEKTAHATGTDTKSEKTRQ